MFIEQNKLVKLHNGSICKIHSFCEATKRWIVLVPAYNGFEASMMRLTEKIILEMFTEEVPDDHEFVFPYHLDKWLFLTKVKN
jgi:hypothetical protein